MKKTDIAKRRLLSQRVVGTGFSGARDVVSWLGAVQAQDYGMAKWGIGLRMTAATARTVEDTIDSGSIVRTHVMRPTWHFVSAEDIRWLLRLTGPRIQAAVAHRQRWLGLDVKTLNRAHKIIAKALEGENHLTRAELTFALARKKIATDVERGTHIMMAAELDQIVCNGKKRGKQMTYALMDERVPAGPDLTRDEALAKLATRYFASHGPATLKDFVWWSGLSVADARAGLESIRSRLASEDVDGSTYWMSPAASPLPRKSVHLLPAFDEFTVSYTDRSASVAPELAKIVAVGHAIFRPIVVVNGRVTGIWTRKHVKSGIHIAYTMFEDLTKPELALLTRAEKSYRSFETNPAD